MSSIPLFPYTGKRACLRRVSDARLFSGWTMMLSPVRAKIRLSADLPQTNDEMLVVVFGEASHATFSSRVRANDGQVVLVEVEGEILQINDTIDLPMRGTGSLRAELITETSTVTVSVLKVGPDQLGFQSARPMDIGERTQMTVVTSIGEVPCTGNVVSCVPMSPESSWFSTELVLDPMNRVDRARWRRLCSEMKEVVLNRLPNDDPRARSAR